MAEKVKTYTNGELSIVWKPGQCIHSEKCWRGLNTVFDPKARPWINAEGASSAEIKAQIDQCPSGALAYLVEGEKPEDGPAPERIRVDVIRNGPLMVHADCSIVDADGNETQKDTKVFFCRCGASENKPYCDGTHKKIGFEG
ncbi:MAG: (4Fe-4S)-binding protein [Bacteroidota bacterium]